MSMSIQHNTNFSTLSVNSTKSDKSVSHIAKHEPTWRKWATHMNCISENGRPRHELRPKIQNMFQLLLEISQQDLNQCGRLLKFFPPNMLPLIGNRELTNWHQISILKETHDKVHDDENPDETSKMKLATLSNLLSARHAAEKLSQSGCNDETDWQEQVWNKIAEVDDDLRWRHGNLRLKLSNGIYTPNGLPNELCGSSQKPDFVWATQHDILDKFGTVSLDGSHWCECVGEGKPPVSTDNHALRQAIMAGAACLYHQLSLHETSPQMLIFAINGALIEFMQMRAEPVSLQPNLNAVVGGFPSQWKLIYTPVSDFSIDLKDFKGCLQFRALTSALITKNIEFHDHFVSLWRSMEDQAVKMWWVSREKKSQQSLLQSRSMSTLPGTPSASGTDQSRIFNNNEGNQSTNQPANTDTANRHTGNQTQGKAMQYQMKKFGISMKNAVNRITVACKSLATDLFGMPRERSIDIDGITT